MYKDLDFKEKFTPLEIQQTQELGFYKKEESWFADIPSYIQQGGTEASCLMVENTPDLLNYLSQGKDKITLEIGLSPLRNSNGNLNNEVILIREKTDVEAHEDLGGAIYMAIIVEPQVVMHCWLCTVNTFVFGGTHPELIFVRTKKEDSNEKV